MEGMFAAEDIGHGKHKGPGAAVRSEASLLRVGALPGFCAFVRGP